MLDKEESIFTTPTLSLKHAYDLGTLATLLGLSAQQLGYFLYRSKITQNYTTFEIKKKNGGIRQICAPNDKLKFLQRNIAKELSTLREFKPYVTGFVNSRSILDNANFHVGQRHVLNIDIENFFGSINFGRIFGMLCKPPHNLQKDVAAAIGKAVIFNNALPQGAPSSPILANLICAKMDSELSRMCKIHKCTYSRYADDITISSHRKKFSLAHFEDKEGPSDVKLSEELTNIIHSNGFKINGQKTRLYSKEWRQEVTGLVVNLKPNVKRKFIRNVRATLNAIEKYGLSNAQEVFEKDFGGTADLSYSLAGRIGFVGQIRGKDDLIYRSLVRRFNAIDSSVKLRTVPTAREIAEAAVWVLEGQSATDHNPIQGTAFFLSGIGLVTCAHCISENMEIYYSRNPSQKYKVEIVKIDKNRDVAILTVPTILRNHTELKMGDPNSSQSESKIWLLGYPNHAPWKPIRAESGVLVRKFPKSAISYLEVSTKVISGNSGGPVTNENFEVIGIAHKGVTENTAITEAEYLAISIDEIRALL